MILRNYLYIYIYIFFSKTVTCLCQTLFYIGLKNSLKVSPPAQKTYLVIFSTLAKLDRSLRRNAKIWNEFCKNKSVTLKLGWQQKTKFFFPVIQFVTWIYPQLVEGHQQPLKGSHFHHSKKVTNWITWRRGVFFYFFSWIFLQDPFFFCCSMIDGSESSSVLPRNTKPRMFLGHFYSPETKMYTPEN